MLLLDVRRWVERDRMFSGLLFGHLVRFGVMQYSKMTCSDHSNLQLLTTGALCYVRLPWTSVMCGLSMGSSLENISGKPSSSPTSNYASIRSTLDRR